MSRRTAIWIGFGLVLLHNLEEILGMGAFLSARRATLPGLLREMTAGRFAVSLAMATLILLGLTWVGARSRRGGAWLVAAVAMHAAMGFNAIQHGAAAAWSGGYAPGMITGAALTLPFAVWIVVRAVTRGWVGARPLVVAAAAMTGLTLPLLAGLHLLSGALIGLG